MIDIKNGYIKNDRGPKRQAMYDEAVRKGFATPYEVWAYSGDYCFVSGREFDCGGYKFIKDKTELTLADFEKCESKAKEDNKVKKFKYVKAELTSSEIAIAMINGEVFYSSSGKYLYTWDEDRGDFINGKGSDVSIFGDFYRKVEVTWQDELKLHLDGCIELNQSVCDFFELVAAAPGKDSKWDAEFIKACRIVVEGTKEIEL